MLRKMLFGGMLMFGAFSAQAANLAKGELDVQFMQQAKPPYVQAQGVLKASPDKVWKALSDFERYPQYFQYLTRVEVRERKGNQAKVYAQFDFPFPVNRVWVVNLYTLDAAQKRLSWKMLEGNLKNTDGSGSWSLKPYTGNQTLATYRLNVSGSGPNQWIQQRAATQSAPGVFKYLNQKLAR